ncbi:MAG TPA: hypothetical protein ENG81_01035 [Candidatus Bathyarchaeota archaeon]|nr:hypothetical protein [Candidatus Bathyarchaeota archaeon]
MKSLREFYNNKDQKENVYNYLIDELQKEAVIRVFLKEDTTGIADAKIVIDKAFSNLDTLFDSKAEPKEQVNEAR